MRNAIILAFVLLSFGTTLWAAKFQEEDKKNREFAEPDENTAVVYIIRSAKTGVAVTFWSFVDDKYFVVTKGPGYGFVVVEPGTHVLWSKSETIKSIIIEIEAGKTYYFKQKMKMGVWKSDMKLELMKEKEAKKALKKLPYSRPLYLGEQRAQDLINEYWGSLRIELHD